MNNEAKLVREIDRLKDSGREFEGLEPVAARVSKQPRAVFSLRLSADELMKISEAARNSGTNVGDFVREAALAAAGEAAPVPSPHDLAEALDHLDKASNVLRARVGTPRRLKTSNSSHR